MERKVEAKNNYAALTERLQWELVPEIVSDEKALMDWPVADCAGEIVPRLLCALRNIRDLGQQNNEQQADKKGSLRKEVAQLLSDGFHSVDVEVREIAPWEISSDPGGELRVKHGSFVSRALKSLDGIICNEESSLAMMRRLFKGLVAEATATQGKLFKRLNSLPQQSSEGENVVEEPANGPDPSGLLAVLRSLQRVESFTFLTKTHIATAVDSLLRSIGCLPAAMGQQQPPVGQQQPEALEAAVSKNLGCLQSPVPPAVALLRPASTLISMPFPVVVPGGRFVECYYWDTYFVVRGLCCLGQTEVASEVLFNFCSCVDRFGFVPNGTRTYYLDRGQPPLFCDAVRVAVEALDGQEKRGDLRRGGGGSPDDEEDSGRLLPESASTKGSPNFSTISNLGSDDGSPDLRSSSSSNMASPTRPGMSNCSTSGISEAAAFGTGAAEKLLWQAYPRLLREYFGFWMNEATGHMFLIECCGGRGCELPATSPAAKKNSPDLTTPLVGSLLFSESPKAGTFHRYVKSLRAACSCGLPSASSRQLDELVLNRYYSTLAEPRPESCTADLRAMDILAASFRPRPGVSLEESKAHTLRCIRAAAESGWDFSSRFNTRWIMGYPRGADDLDDDENNSSEAQRLKFFENIDTVNLIPCDLNAFLFQAERNLARFSARLASVHLAEMSRPLLRKKEAEAVLSALSRCISTKRSCAKCRHDALMAYIKKSEDPAVTDHQQHQQREGGSGGGKNQFVCRADVILLLQLAYLEALFSALAAARQHAMSLVLWDHRNGIWRDFHVATLRQSAVVSAACVIPTWAGVVPTLGGMRLCAAGAHRFASSSSLRTCLKQHEEPVVSVRGVPVSLLRPYGLVTTAEYTAEQWDYPNVWPPLMLFAVEVLVRKAPSCWSFYDIVMTPDDDDEEGCSNDDDCSELGLQIARNFLESIAIGLRNCVGRDAASFFEKYDAHRPGVAGGGGEYPNQLGFAWTCGIVLEFVSRLGAKMLRREEFS